MTTEFQVTQSDEGDFYLHKDGWEHQDPLSKVELLDMLEEWIEEHSEGIA